MLQLECECGRKLQVDESHAGKRGRCKSCGRLLDIPKSSDTVSRENASEQTHASDVGRVNQAGSLRSQQKLGQFVVLRKLGEGAMGEVWLASDDRLEREVAIKVLPDDLRRDPERLRRFEREAKLMAKLHHPHAVTVHHFGDDDDLLYLVMEYVNGGSLADRVHASGPLPWREATRAIRDAAAGLAEAHRLGLVHRDVKPANLLQTNEGVTKVGDFGLARPLVQETQLTQQVGMLGTPSYMAPEQWAGKPADVRSDLYALICSYYYLLTGGPPFDADSWLALGLQHQREPIPDPRLKNPDIPQSVMDVLAYGSQKDPANRIQTADELVALLDAILVLTSPTTSARKSTRASAHFAEAIASVAGSWLPRIPRIAWIAAGSGAILLLLGIVFFVRTPLGRMRIEVSDPQIEVSVDGTKEISPGREWLKNASCEEGVIDGKIPGWENSAGNWMAKNGGRSPLAKSTVPVSFPSNPTAQEFMDIILPELKNNNPMVMWDALPAAKQKQVQEVVSLASSRVEQRTMNLIKKFRSDLLAALKSKKQFVLNSSALPIPPDQKDVLAKSYDSIVAMLEAYVPTEWLDASYLQNAELRDVLSSYVHNIVLKGKDLENSLPDNSPFKSMINRMPLEAKVESVSATEAMVTFVVPGQPEIQSKFILSEGRWLPADLLAGWDKAMAQATGVLGQLDPKIVHQSVGQGLLFANGLLGSISSAESQQEFDEAIGQLVGMGQMIPGMAGVMPPGSTPPSNSPPAKGRPGLQQSR